MKSGDGHPSRAQACRRHDERDSRRVSRFPQEHDERYPDGQRNPEGQTPASGQFDGTVNNANALTFDGKRTVNFEKLQKSNAGTATLTDIQNTPTVTMTADDTTFNVDGTVQAAGATPRTSTVITGNAGKNTVRVGAGATLHATGDLGGGNDVLDVAGTLEIRGGAFNLGAGDDSFIVGDSTRVVGDIHAGAGNDVIDARINGSKPVALGGLNEFEALTKSGVGTLRINGAASVARARHCPWPRSSRQRPHGHRSREGVQPVSRRNLRDAVSARPPGVTP
jgi:hypothetical protein